MDRPRNLQIEILDRAVVDELIGKVRNGAVGMVKVYADPAHAGESFYDEAGPGS